MTASELNANEDQPQWTGFAGAAVAALLFAAASPPHGYAAAAWLVPGLLLASVRHLSMRAAFGAGICFGVVSGAIVGLWATDAFAAALQVPTALSFLTVGAALLVCVGLPSGLATAAYNYAGRRVAVLDLPVAGAFFWITTEWLRAQMLGWQLLGHTQYREIWLIQIADLGGVYAVSFVVAFASIAAVETLRDSLGGRARMLSAARALAVPALTIAAAVGYSSAAQQIYGSHDVAEDAMQASSVAMRPTASQHVRNYGPRPQLQIRRVSTIEQSGMRVSPLLCADVLDAGVVHGAVRDGADVLINNCRVDWLRSPQAAEQHLALAVLRSVEARRFVVRSTGDGGGELITALGETYTERPAGQSISISNATTRYMRWGDNWIFFGLGMSLIVVGRSRKK